MGNCLDMPQQPGTTPQNAQPPRQGVGSRVPMTPTSPVMLPFNNFTVNPDGIEQQRQDGHHYEEANNNLEVETLKMDTSFISGNTSQYSVGSKGVGNRRYIKRYRNEEEKLIDMLQEREKLLNSAVQQGQQLRAKCNRYEEELDSLRETTRLDINETQWKKKYFEADRKYRDVKEEVDVMVARNRNGRDILRQQQDNIDTLNLELQREKIERQRLLSSSLTSLHSTGIGDNKKRKILMTQLHVDNSLLQNRVEELTQRNARGREYLSKLEAEKRDQTVLISKLREKLNNEKEEKESLLSRLGAASSTGKPDSNVADKRQSHYNGHALYATVQKPGKQAHATTMSFGEEQGADAKSTGFEIDESKIHPIEPERQYNVLSGVYDEVELLPLETTEDSPRDNCSSPTGDLSESMEEKSVNELNAEAITEQINVDTEPSPKDITSFTPHDNPYAYPYDEENGIPNDEALSKEETLTKF